MKKVIPQRYFDELKDRGNTVPRYTKTGELIPFTVGSVYTIVAGETKEQVTAKCTQDCPYNLRLIEPSK